MTPESFEKPRRFVGHELNHSADAQLRLAASVTTVPRLLLGDNPQALAGSTTASVLCVFRRIRVVSWLDRVFAPNLAVTPLNSQLAAALIL